MRIEIDPEFFENYGITRLGNFTRLAKRLEPNFTDKSLYLKFLKAAEDCDEVYDEHDSSHQVEGQTPIYKSAGFLYNTAEETLNFFNGTVDSDPLDLSSRVISEIGHTEVMLIARLPSLISNIVQNSFRYIPKDELENSPMKIFTVEESKRHYFNEIVGAVSLILNPIILKLLQNAAGTEDTVEIIEYLFKRSLDSEKYGDYFGKLNTDSNYSEVFFIIEQDHEVSFENLFNQLLELSKNKAAPLSWSLELLH